MKTTALVHATKTKLFFAALVATSSLVFGVKSISTIQAQTAETDNQLILTAIPPRLGEDSSIKLKPGEKTQVTIRVRNSSNTPLQIQTQARDFIIGEDGSTPLPVDGSVSNRWALSNWVTVTPALQTLDPNETAGIAVLIDVPEDALPGGHYAMITHAPVTGDPQENLSENSGTAGISQEVGTLLYVIVDGPINEQAFIRDFSFNDGKFAEFGPVNYAFTIENESDIHIRPQLGLDIYDIFGKKVAALQPETKNIFPLTSREFEGSWDQVWGSGLYRAELTASYGQQGSIIMAKTTFWLLPIRLVIAILILILTLIAIMVSVRRHILHRRDDRNAKIEILEEKLRQMEADKLKKFED